MRTKETKVVAVNYETLDIFTRKSSKEIQFVVLQMIEHNLVWSHASHHVEFQIRTGRLLRLAMRSAQIPSAACLGSSSPMCIEFRPFQFQFELANALASSTTVPVNGAAYLTEAPVLRFFCVVWVARQGYNKIFWACGSSWLEIFKKPRCMRALLQTRNAWFLLEDWWSVSMILTPVMMKP